MKKEKSSGFISRSNLRLLKKLCDLYPRYSEHETDTNSLSEQLHCSTRNVPKIMKKMSAMGWVDWKSGRGRGNRSTLIVNVEFSAILLIVLKEYCRRGQLSEAVTLSENFNFIDSFYTYLPSWLSDASRALKSQNTLISLVPYYQPELHPLKAEFSNSKLYIEAMFDTLLKFDKYSGKNRPHLAHHYEYRGNDLWLRIQPDVYFHNGKRLTAKLVAKNILDRIQQKHVYELLYRHVKEVSYSNSWVVLEMAQKDFMILHLLSELSSSIYLKEDTREIPYGTGPFVLESTNLKSWVLTKNREYFHERGLIDRAEFWMIDKGHEVTTGHIVHNGFLPNSKEADIKFPLDNGCEVLEFNCHENGLTLDERAWVIKQARDFCENTSSPFSPIANSVAGFHQDKCFHIPNVDIKKPNRVVRIVKPKEKETKRIALLSYLRSCGLDIVEVRLEQRNLGFYDIDITGYLSQDNHLFAYYKWLLCSEGAQYSLSESKKEMLVAFVDQLLLSSVDEVDFFEQLYRCEDWLIQNCISVPLWRECSSYSVVNTIQGIKPDSTGILSLRKIWIND